MSSVLPIVGIGASAGGLEALSELLGALPGRLGAAVLVVQHLDRNHASLLSEILGRQTTLAVTEAVHGSVPGVDTIHVIPPNATMTLVEGRVHLTPRPKQPQIHLPVDALFKSIAEDRGLSGLGVVLSGADSDGAAGIQAIKTAGGITFAQEPRTARVPSMPQSAIETGCVDFVLRPAHIAAELARMAGLPYLQALPSENAEESQFPEPKDANDSGLRRVFRRLHAAHGVDFSRYKPATLQRRLARRMALQKTGEIEEYLSLMESDPVEAAALYQDFLIRVTNFFRDPEVFEALREHVFPGFCVNRSTKEPIRIWVPGCATGEEVYSIAIALTEFLSEYSAAYPVQIFGTDVSEVAIEKARSGRYLDSIAQELSAERLNRFFVRENRQYTVARSIRELCIFARQDITRDPPFSRLDLVSCRNVLIYLSTPSQQRVMQIFHYALRKRGTLMLGPAESAGHMSDLFELIDKQHRFYRPKPNVTSIAFDTQHSSIAPGVSRALPSADASDNSSEAELMMRQADRWFLARYAPAGILVDASFNILQFRGDTGPLLSPANGPPSSNLQRVARPELVTEMIAALQEARESGGIARRPGLSLPSGGPVDMEVVPLTHPGSTASFLFVFEYESQDTRGRRSRTMEPLALDSDLQRRNAQLERENSDLREFLRATLEQHEAAREQLHSANEEVLSANEEFQSTNEELETSKEELQSLNEELMTTNEELHVRNRQLNVLNSEVENARKRAEVGRSYADEIIETVRDPLLVLDDELRIVRANRAFYTFFKLNSGSRENRPLHEIADGQWNSAELQSNLLSVLERAASISDLELAWTHSDLGVRVLCLNARRMAADTDRAPLILVSIEDVTEARNRADNLREGHRRKDEFLAMLAHELRNPLGPITHAVHLLKRDSSDAPQLCEMIERQTARLVRLVDELLDVARINRGLIELKREPTDLAAIVRSAIEAGKARLEQRGHTLSIGLPEGPVCVDGDSIRLEQVVANLLENATKYTNPGGHLEINLSETDAEGLLTVADDGIGIEPDMLERIFDVFNQVDSSLARSGGGLGLGLTVVRRVVEMHGGRIEAHSEGLGKGSQFLMRIPLLPKSRADESVWRGFSTPTEERVRQRILIVDDNTDAAESVSILLSTWGHEVSVAHTGTQALEIASRFRPQIALLDIGLPDIDGYALAQRLRAARPNDGLQLIAMTGYGRPEDREAARLAGFDRHLTKPANIDELARILNHGP